LKRFISDAGIEAFHCDLDDALPQPSPEAELAVKLGPEMGTRRKNNHRQSDRIASGGGHGRAGAET